MVDFEIGIDCNDELPPDRIQVSRNNRFVFLDLLDGADNTSASTSLAVGEAVLLAHALLAFAREIEGAK